MKARALPTVGSKDVSSRFVRLRLDRESDVVATIDNELGEKVESLPEALQGRTNILCGVGVRTLTPTPEDISRRSELGGEVEIAHDLANRVSANLTIVARESPVLEDRVGEEVGRDHGHDDASGIQGVAEPLDPPCPLGIIGPEGDQVVVMKSHTVRAQLGKAGYGFDRVKRVACGVPEGVPRLPAHRPKSKRETIITGRRQHQRTSSALR